MPVTHDLDPEAGLIRTRCAGNVTLVEVLAHFRGLADEPELPERLDVMLDLRLMESLPSREQITSVVEAVGQFEDRFEGRLEWGSWAIVAERDALFGMFRAFEVLANDSLDESRVFRSAEEAESWLASLRPTVT